MVVLEVRNNSLWKHSIQAVDDFFRRDIGDLSSNSDEYRWRWCLRDDLSNVAFSRDLWIQSGLWRLSENPQLHSANVKTIYFTNPKFRVRAFLRGIRWMGKHILVTGQNGTTRMYSISITFSRQAQAYLNQMKGFYNLVSEKPREVKSPGHKPPKHALVERYSSMRLTRTIIKSIVPLKVIRNALGSPKGIPFTRSVPTNPAEPIVTEEGHILSNELDMPHLWPIRPKEIEELPVTFKCYAAPPNMKVPAPKLPQSLLCVSVCGGQKFTYLIVRICLILITTINGIWSIFPQNPEAAAPINMNKRRRGKKAVELKPMLIEITENSVADSYVNMSQFEFETPDKTNKDKDHTKDIPFAARDAGKEKTCMDKTKDTVLPLLLPTLKTHVDPEHSLSTELFFSSGPGKKLLIEGPIGRGYEFDVDFRGKLVIITGGTGYVPFADLISALFLRAVFQGLQQLGAKAEIIEDIKRFHERYSTLLEKAHVKLLAAFDSEKELFEKSFINETYAICKKHDFKFFDCLLRFSKDSERKNYSLVVPTTKRRFEEATLLQEHVDSADLIVLCGPPNLTSGVYKTLIHELAFPSTKIVFH